MLRRRGNAVPRSPRCTRRAVVGGLSTVIATLAIAAPASAFTFGFGSSQARNVTCNLRLHALIPQPAPTAANVGIVRCDNGIGWGAQRDSSVTTRTGPLTGSFTGPFTMYFEDGFLNGTFTIAFVTTVGGNPLHITGVTYNGTVDITGGTDDYRRVRGGGTVTGFSPDAVDTQLTEKLALTGL
jgi:hypothetical protein